MEIVRADLANRTHRDGVLAVLESYSQDPIGAGRPLSDAVRENVIAGLRDHPTTEILLAFAVGRAVGVAVCFLGFSTFRARRLLNVHDLAVLPEHRGQGVGRRLLEGVEARARELGCCKLTLEVLERNARARGLYERFGFGAYAPGVVAERTLFLEKPLPEGDRDPT